MSDEPDRQDLEDRVEQLEATIAKMLPSRRDALKLGGAALVGGAAMSGSASAGTSQAGTIGTANEPVDVESEDINNTDTVTTQDLVVNGTATGVAQDLQGSRVFLTSDQSLTASSRHKVTFDSEVYDSDSNFNTTSHNFVCPKTGIYAANAQALFTAGSDGEMRRLMIGNGSSNTPNNEGAFKAKPNSFRDSTLMVSTINKYTQGDKIALYAENEGSNDNLSSGVRSFRTFLEVVFLGSL